MRVVSDYVSVHVEDSSVSLTVWRGVLIDPAAPLQSSGGSGCYDIDLTEETDWLQISSDMQSFLHLGALEALTPSRGWRESVSPLWWLKHVVPFSCYSLSAAWTFTWCRCVAVSLHARRLIASPLPILPEPGVTFSLWIPPPTKCWQM